MELEGKTEWPAPRVPTGMDPPHCYLSHNNTGGSSPQASPRPGYFTGIVGCFSFVFLVWFGCFFLSSMEFPLLQPLARRRLRAASDEDQQTHSSCTLYIGPQESVLFI